MSLSVSLQVPVLAESALPTVVVPVTAGTTLLTGAVLAISVVGGFGGLGRAAVAVVGGDHDA